MAGPASLKPSDIARALQAVRKGGMEPGRTDINFQTGCIVIFAKGEPVEALNDLDKWTDRHADYAKGHQ